MNNADEKKVTANANLKEAKSTINSGCPFCEGPMNGLGQFKHKPDCPYNV
jgi:hypothetical protein